MRPDHQFPVSISSTCSQPMIICLIHAAEYRHEQPAQAAACNEASDLLASIKWPSPRYASIMQRPEWADVRLSTGWAVLTVTKPCFVRATEPPGRQPHVRPIPVAAIMGRISREGHLMDASRSDASLQAAACAGCS